MRELTRLLLLLLLTSVAIATETSTALDYDVRQSNFTTTSLNNATQVTLSSTEQNVVITCAPTYPVVVQFAQGATTNSWTYSTVSATSTQTTTVAAGQNCILCIFPGTTTLYLKSASGVTLSISPLTYFRSP
jgi:hypothetical protein